jgi:hypothetical protein
LFRPARACWAHRIRQTLRWEPWRSDKCLSIKKLGMDILPGLAAPAGIFEAASSCAMAYRNTALECGMLGSFLWSRRSEFYVWD